MKSHKDRKSQIEIDVRMLADSERASLSVREGFEELIVYAFAGGPIEECLYLYGPAARANLPEPSVVATKPAGNVRAPQYLAVDIRGARAAGWVHGKRLVAEALLDFVEHGPTGGPPPAPPPAPVGGGGGGGGIPIDPGPVKSYPSGGDI